MKGTVLVGLTFILVVTALSLLFIPSKSLPIIDPPVRGLVQSVPTPSPTVWTLLVTGDVIPARVTNQKMVEKNDFMWPLRGIAQELERADITLINLEAPLINNCPLTNEGFKFCGEDDFAKALADSGVDVANLANNHTLNYGWEAIAETEKVLTAVGIETTGFAVNDPVCSQNTVCSKFLIKSVKDTTLGFLGYNAVGQRVDREKVMQEIEAADTHVDVLIVSVHWGKEYERSPVADASLAPDDPKELGKLFVDWGADVVVGNHPHWYQGYEFYKEKPIFYAMGNTVFDQEWSPETKVGYLAKLTFSGTQTNKESLEIFPTGIRDFGEAYLLEGTEAANIKNEVHF